MPEYCSDSFSVGDPGPALARVPIGGSRGPIEVKFIQNGSKIDFSLNFRSILDSHRGFKFS